MDLPRRRRVKVVHGLVDASGRELVGGVNNSIQQLATAQTDLGHDVSVLSRERGRGHLAAAVGALRSARAFAYVVRRRPDVLHLHSAYSPMLALLSFVGRRLGVPVVLSPRGAYAPQLRARHNWAKRAYVRMVEIPHVRRASVVAALTSREADSLQDWQPSITATVVGNGVAAPSVMPARPTCSPGHRHQAVYLGRFDSTHKGLDRVLALASALPDVDFALFGGRGTLPADTPTNVSVCGPVFGAAKWMSLSACFYVHLARWETYGRSIVEAMHVGTPVVLSRGCDLSAEIEAQRLGLTLDCAEPTKDAQLVLHWLTSGMAERNARSARQWVEEQAMPNIVAARTLALYQEVRAAAGARSWWSSP